MGEGDTSPRDPSIPSSDVEERKSRKSSRLVRRQPSKSNDDMSSVVPSDASSRMPTIATRILVDGTAAIAPPIAVIRIGSSIRKGRCVMINSLVGVKTVSFRPEVDIYPEELSFQLGDDMDPRQQLISVEVYADAKERKLYGRQLLYFTDLVERGSRSGLPCQSTAGVPLTDEGLQFGETLSLELSMTYRPRGTSASPLPAHLNGHTSSGASSRSAGSRTLSRANSRDRLTPRPGLTPPRTRGASPMPPAPAGPAEPPPLYSSAGSLPPPGGEPPRSPQLRGSGHSSPFLDVPTLARPSSWHAESSARATPIPAEGSRPRPIPEAGRRESQQEEARGERPEASFWDSFKGMFLSCNPLAACRERQSPRGKAGRPLPSRPAFACFNN